MRTAIASVKIGWLAYVIPFLLVFSPGLIMATDAKSILLTAAAVAGGVFMISIALIGYFLRPLGMAIRLLAGISGLLLCLPFNSFGWAGSVVAVAAMTGLLLLEFEFVKSKRAGKQ